MLVENIDITVSSSFEPQKIFPATPTVIEKH